MNENEWGTPNFYFASVFQVNQYYNLATDFYEWGWGSSFHFAIQRRGEHFETAISRHEHYLALRLGLKEDWKVLDVGCGVGGPARNIARLAGCEVTGLNNNAYQVARGTTLTEQQGLQHHVSLVKGNFMKMPFEDNKFDAVYQIEATAHAPDKTACYAEILRVLKPGALFCGYEWCLTPDYDPTDAMHQSIKKDIEEGNGLPDIATFDEVLDAMRAAGFEDVEGQDFATKARDGFEYPWEYYLTPSYFTPTRFQFTPLGTWLVEKALTVLETVHLVPKGTCAMQVVLRQGGAALGASGAKGLFTPMYFHIGRKPEAEK